MIEPIHNFGFTSMNGQFIRIWDCYYYTLKKVCHRRQWLWSKTTMVNLTKVHFRTMNVVLEKLWQLFYG